MDRIHSSKDFDVPYDLETRPISNRSGVLEPAKVTPLKAKTSEELKSDEKAKESTPLKKLAKFFISHFGLLVLVLFYVAGGAYLFQLLEQHNEIQNCQLGEGDSNKMIKSYRTNIFNYIYLNTTYNPWLPVDNSTVIQSLNTPKDGPSVYNPKLTQMLNDFADEVNSIKDKYKYSGQDCEKTSLWNYCSAILFTIAVVTTMGYGHVAPSTWEGQIVCICYATLGIPLFLMSVANVSGILGDMFRFLYSSVCCFACKSCMGRENNKSKEKSSEDKEEEMEDPEKPIKDKKVKVVDDDDEDEQADGSHNKVTVPLIFVITTLVAYMIFGGYIFSLIETWGMVQGTYFSFISLATIGFGDLVPGITQLSSGNESIGVRNLIIAVIYIFIGMAILAMCFDLMQDELIEKVTLIAEKLGIKTDDDEDKDEPIVINDKHEDSKVEQDDQVAELDVKSFNRTQTSFRSKDKLNKSLTSGRNISSNVTETPVLQPKNKSILVRSATSRQHSKFNLDQSMSDSKC